jgi:hypothetical protein
MLKEANDRLIARMAQYESPEPRGMALQDLVIVYRFPSKEKEKFKRIEGTDKVIHFADISQKEPLPYSLGLLLAAGGEAMEVLLSHGVLPGDIVRFAPLAGDEETAARVDEALERALEANPRATEEEQMAVQRAARDADLEKKKLLRLKAADIHESLDLLDRLYGPAPTMEMVRDIAKDGSAETLIFPILAA